jgi:hypothetical protein
MVTLNEQSEYSEQREAGENPALRFE